MVLSRNQIRLIIQNPNINAGVLAKLIGAKQQTVTSFRFRNNITAKWHYKGFGIPFTKARGDDRYQIEVQFRNKSIASSNRLDKTIGVVDHLIYCINNDFFNMPRVENPYLEGLKLGEQP